MQTYTLTRDGDAPLVFEGELLAQSIGAYLGASEERRAKQMPWPRHNNLSIYRTRGGAFVVHLEYVSHITSKKRLREPSRSWAYQVETPRGVANLLRQLACVDEETLRCPATAGMFPEYRPGRQFLNVKVLGPARGQTRPRRPA